MAPSMLVAAGSCFLAVASGLQIRGATSGPGFVHVPLSHERRDGTLVRRDVAGAASIDIANFKTAGYTIQLSIGTPGQNVDVAVDTGSSELWVNPDCSRSSRARNTTNSDGSVTVNVDSVLTDPAMCRSRGNYDPSRSSSRKDSTLEDDVFQYGDMTTATVRYVQDRIAIGALAIEDQTFGVATESNGTGIGIMGLGPSPFGFNNSGTYPLILTTMAQQGVIRSPAFSLDLRDYDNSTGAIIFGGVDKKKYAGSLAKIPFQTVERRFSNGGTFQHTSYYVTVRSMGMVLPGTTSPKQYSIPDGGTFIASLDCGAGANLLPPGLAANICADLNATTIEGSNNACIVDCAVRQRPGGLHVGLEGKDILVPYENLINEQVTDHGSTCVVMVNDNTLFTDPPLHILGAPFLRSTYAVFDWGNGNLHIAQAADCGSNIVAIGNGTDSVPGGAGECSRGAISAVNLGFVATTALLASLLLL